jgi:GWxTD domain-containing protein
MESINQLDARRVLGALLVSVLLGLGTAPRALAQTFSVDAVSVRADEDSSKTRLDLYTKIPYANLTFLKVDGGFEAQYEMTAEVYALGPDGEKKRLVTSRVWDRTVRVDSYKATQTDRAHDPTTQSLLLEPERYRVEFQLEDGSSGETFTRNRLVFVRDLNGDVALSDLLLLDDFERSSNTIYPNVTGRVETEQGQVQFFYELYADQGRSLRVKRELIRYNEQDLPSVRAMLGLIKKEPDAETVYSETETRQVEAGRSQVVATAPLDKVRAGDYAVRVAVKRDTGRVLADASKPLTIRWSGLDKHIAQLDDAVAQLQYIAKDDEYDRLQNASTREEQLERFRAFWEKRDPTPSTERNERMEEYYFRIASANDEYGTLRDGWRTDRGHVRVLFGKPDYVERHPYNYNSKPYQIWYYYRVGRRFIFVDETGMGQYELLVPIWDERTRIR